MSAETCPLCDQPLADRQTVFARIDGKLHEVHERCETRTLSAPRGFGQPTKPPNYYDRVLPR